MVYFFSHFKNHPAMNLEQQHFIHFFLENLKYPNSYQSVLQYLYNNSVHFSDQQYGFTPESLSQFVSRLFSNEVFEIQGNIHHNSHKSEVIRDANTGDGTFVKDYYIRINDIQFNRVYHIIIERPDVRVLHNIYPPFPVNFIITPKFRCKE
jgi:hypothetical protein